MSQNPDVSGILTIEVKDTLAPIITAINTSSSGTTTVTVTLSVTTDETAICRFTTSNSSLNYSSMINQMSTTNSTLHSHSQPFTSDTSGNYSVRCNDTIGNVMNYSNSTSYNADVQEPSSGGGSGGGGSSGGGGVGGTGKYTCKLDWECTPWTECRDGKQARKCKLVDVSAFTSLNECPQKTIPEQERSCETKAGKKAACSDGIRNQNEEGVDCGGPCGPCFVIENKEEKTKESAVSTGPTGAVVGAPFGNAKKWGWLVTLLIIIIGLILYHKLRKKLQ